MPLVYRHPTLTQSIQRMRQILDHTDSYADMVYVPMEELGQVLSVALMYASITPDPMDSPLGDGDTVDTEEDDGDSDW